MAALLLRGIRRLHSRSLIKNNFPILSYSTEIRQIFEEHNRGIAATYQNVSEAKQKETSNQRKATSVSNEEEKADLKADLKAKVDEYIQHYTEGCRFLSPGQPVLIGRDAFGAVLREYSSDRGLATIDITIEEVGPLGSGGDTFYERGFTVFEGEKFRQKNNHLSIRKKTVVDGKTTFPIDVLIFNEIENIVKE